MQIGTVNASAAPAVMPKPPETVEGPGPDRDNDGDNKAAAVQSATAATVGKTVDKTA